MLQLFANDQQLDTSGVKFNLTLKNPMFTDGLEGSYVFGLATPLSDKNKTIYGFPHRLEMFQNYSKNFDFKGSFNGIPLPITGNNKVTDINDKSIKSNVGIAIGEFISFTKNKTLKDIDLGGDYTFASSIDKNVYIVNSIYSGYPDYKFAKFPVYNPDLYKGTSLNTAWQNVNYINGDNPLGNPSPNPDLEVLFIYLGYVVKQIFESFGFNVIQNPFESDEELKKLVLLNYYSDHLLETTTSFNLIDHIPPHNIHSLLTELHKLFGSVYFINHVTREVEIKLYNDILKDHDYVDFSDNIKSKIESELLPLTSGYFFNYKYDSNDSLPQDMIVEYDESFHTLIDPVTSYSDLPDYGGTAYLHTNEVCLVKDENAYYQFEQTGTNPNTYGWLYFSENMYEYSSDDLDPKFEPEISPMLISKHEIDVSGATGSWLTPKCMVGLFKDTDNAWIKGDVEGWENFRLKAVDVFDPRICFYRGVRNKSSGTYPFGTYDIYDYDSNIIGTKSLRMDGDTGIYKNFWERYVNWYHKNRRPVKFIKMLTPVELRNLDFSKKHRINGIDYFIKGVKTPVSSKSIGYSTLECLKA